MKRLGAILYIDSESQNAVEELAKLGGAKVILGTVPSGKAMSAVLGGLGELNCRVPCLTSIMNTLTPWHRFFIYCKMEIVLDSF